MCLNKHYLQFKPTLNICKDPIHRYSNYLKYFCTYTCIVLNLEHTMFILQFLWFSCFVSLKAQGFPKGGKYKKC